MHTRLIDPRNVDGEVPEPVYRVYFTEANATVREIRVTGARDITEVIAWAKNDAHGIPFTVYCEHPSAVNSHKVTLSVLYSQ